MLSSVLRSRRAILVNVEIMRAFVLLRHLLASNAELAQKLDELERKYDVALQSRIRRHQGAYGTSGSRRKAADWVLSARGGVTLRDSECERRPLVPPAAPGGSYWTGGRSATSSNSTPA